MSTLKSKSPRISVRVVGDSKDGPGRVVCTWTEKGETKSREFPGFAAKPGDPDANAARRRHIEECKAKCLKPEKAADPAPAQASAPKPRTPRRATEAKDPKPADKD